MGTLQGQTRHVTVKSFLVNTIARLGAQVGPPRMGYERIPMYEVTSRQ